MNNDDPSTDVVSQEPSSVLPSSEFPVVVSVLPRRARWRRVRGSTPIDLRPLAAALPEIIQALRAGELVRIVGSKELLDGIKNGTLQYMQGKVGHLTTVVDQHNKIVGHVQLERASDFARTARALAVYQVASAVTLQYYLHQFDERLEAISTAVRKAREHAAWAEVARAATEAPRLAEELRSGSPLLPDLRRRLDTEERACDVVALQELLPVEEAIASLESLHGEIERRLDERAERGPLRKGTSSVVETMPGGLRSRIIAALDAAEQAMVHWRISCSAAQVHAALAALQMVDDELAGRHASSSVLDSTTARAEGHRRVAKRVGALLALPDDTLSLFAGDGGVVKRMRSLNEVAGVLQGQSQAIADKLDLIANVGELVLAERNGKVLALRLKEAA